MIFFPIFIFFIFGTALGSFFGVIIDRYNPEKFLFNIKNISGRSYCPECKKTLSFWELFPLISFIFLRGKCKNCKKKISLFYPFIELLTGFIMIGVPLFLNYFYGISNKAFFFFTLPGWYYFLVSLWVVTFFCFLFIVLIDIRFFIIPDEINIILILCGIGVASILFFYKKLLPPFSFSFLKQYALILGFFENPFFSRFMGSLVVGGSFLLLFIATKGKGMGMGDVKFVFAAGILFGFSDVIIGTFLAFITGGLWSAFLYFYRKKKMKDILPFGPFLVLGFSLLVFYGVPLFRTYMSFFR